MTSAGYRRTETYPKRKNRCCSTRKQSSWTAHIRAKKLSKFSVDFQRSNSGQIFVFTTRGCSFTFIDLKRPDGELNVIFHED